MYVDTSYYTKNDKRYTRRLLRESYREDGKVKKRTIASLCNCSEDEIAALKFALKNKRDINSLVDLKSIADVSVQQGKSYGALVIIKSIADKLGITAALGKSNNGLLAFWQIYSRLISQGSRQTSIRLSESHETTFIPNLPSVNEKALYKNLQWLSDNQVDIETSMWQFSDRAVSNLFLYDVTSSYLEGEQNELAAYGYNRDKKKGKKQIVIGLLTDDNGLPVAVRVFDGNTCDTNTFGDQITILRDQLKIKNVVIVGDGGMIKTPQQEFLPEDYSYITSISKPQIISLINNNTIQLELFETSLCEVESDNVRYIFRRNPVRQKEIRQGRKEKVDVIEQMISMQNKYLEDHPKANLEVAVRKVKDRVTSLKISSWVEVTSTDRMLSITEDIEKKTEVEKLDGCYCIKTDVTSDTKAEVIHSRYKDLIKVENAFRTMKTGHLDIRPLYLRKTSHTKGHVFVVMMAYMIEKELAKMWKSDDRTIAEALQELVALTTLKIKDINNNDVIKLPKPNQICEELFKLARVKVPDKILP
jgi:transposase